jgi:hypothetical protein
MQVGRSMFQSLTSLGLGLGASETEIKVSAIANLPANIILTRMGGDDATQRRRHATAITDLTASESSIFQLLNNAHEYHKDHAYIIV